MNQSVATERSKRHQPGRWWVVAMLWPVCLLSYADRQAIFSIFPQLKREFGFGPVELGLIGSAFMWVYAAGGPVAGFLADRLARKKIILAACAFWSGVTALTGRCAGLGSFIVVRALGGAGESFYQPSALSLLSDYHGPATRSRAFSLHQSAVYVGTIAGGWLGGWFAERAGWRYGFAGLGGAGLALTLFLALTLREPRRGQAEPLVVEGPADGPLRTGEALRAIWGARTTRLLMAAFVCANLVATIFLSWTPTFLVEKFGLGMGAAGLVGGVCIHCASMVSVPLGGIAADACAVRFARGRIWVQAAGLLGGAVFIALATLSAGLAASLMAMVVFGACKGLYDANIFASLYDEVEPRARGAAAGIMNTVGWGGGALGPVVVGLATKFGRHPRAVDNLSEAMAGSSVVYLIGAGLLLAAARPLMGRTHP